METPKQFNTETRTQTKTTNESSPPGFHQTLNNVCIDEHINSSKKGGNTFNISPSEVSKFSVIKLGIIGLCLAASIGGFMMLFNGAKDDVDSNTKKQWEATFLSAQPLKVPIIESSQIPKALSKMQLPPTDKQNLENDLGAGRTRLVWINLRDNCAEDDDVVKIESGSFSQVVHLKKGGEKIPVPEPPSGVLNIVGMRDGGGGITVEMMSGNSPVNLPVMSEGQALGVPIVLNK